MVLPRPPRTKNDPDVVDAIVIGDPVATSSRKKTNVACVRCVKGKKPCSNARPCPRCVKDGFADTCRSRLVETPKPKMAKPRTTSMECKFRTTQGRSIVVVVVIIGGSDVIAAVVIVIAVVVFDSRLNDGTGAGRPCVPIAVRPDSVTSGPIGDDGEWVPEAAAA